MAGELRMAFRPELRRPVLVTAFRGWNDGGQGATLAAGYLAKVWGAQTFASIDPEGFYDFQVTRPHVSLVDGQTRQIDWPENSFSWARLERADRDVILLQGIEPNLRWRTFVGLVVELAAELAADLAISLGSLLADVPHTRPSPVTGAASDLRLVEELGLAKSTYEGPTGIVGVLHDACHAAGLRSASLWAAVPHYVSLAPSPRAALALCEQLSRILEASIDVEELRQAVEPYTEQVSAAVATDADTVAYVEELERRSDELAASDLPTGEALAAELARFLRDRERGNGEAGPHAEGA